MISVLKAKDVFSCVAEDGELDSNSQIFTLKDIKEAFDSGVAANSGFDSKEFWEKIFKRFLKQNKNDN